MTSSTADVVKEAIVFKRGQGMMAGWKQRYLILYGNQLLKYFVLDGLELKGTIDLSTVKSADVQESKKVAKQNGANYGFAVQTKQRKWEFAIEQFAERDQWIQQIRRVIQQSVSGATAKNNKHNHNHQKTNQKKQKNIMQKHKKHSADHSWTPKQKQKQNTSSAHPSSASSSVRASAQSSAQSHSQTPKHKHSKNRTNTDIQTPDYLRAQSHSHVQSRSFGGQPQQRQQPPQQRQDFAPMHNYQAQSYNHKNNNMNNNYGEGEHQQPQQPQQQQQPSIPNANKHKHKHKQHANHNSHQQYQNHNQNNNSQQQRNGYSALVSDSPPPPTMTMPASSSEPSQSLFSPKAPRNPHDIPDAYPFSHFTPSTIFSNPNEYQQTFNDIAKQYSKKAKPSGRHGRTNSHYERIPNLDDELALSVDHNHNHNHNNNNNNGNNSKNKYTEMELPQSLTVNEPHKSAFAEANRAHAKRLQPKISIYQNFQIRIYKNETRFAKLMFGFIRVNGGERIFYNFPKILQHLCLQYTGFVTPLSHDELYEYFNRESSILHQNVKFQYNFFYAISIGLKNYFWQSIQLIYKGSRDGMTANAFHQKCDGKANTVVLMLTDTNYICGGFTRVPWSCDQQYHEDRKAFMFSLQSNLGMDLGPDSTRSNNSNSGGKFNKLWNKKKKKSKAAAAVVPPVMDNGQSLVKIYRIRRGNEMHAVFHFKEYGPVFGMGHDLCLFSLSDTRNAQCCATTFKLSVEQMVGTLMYFNAVEVEVYQIQENTKITG